MKTQGSVLGRRITGFLFFFALFQPVREADAHSLLEPRENRTASHSGWLLEPRIGYFSTSSNFIEDGTPAALSGSKNTRMLFDLNASFGLSDSLFVFGRVSLLSASIESAGSVTRSNFGLADQLLGVAYRLLSSDSGFGFHLQAEARIPAYQNPNARNALKPYLGDGSLDVTAGGFLEIPGNFTGISDSYLEIGGAYTRRSAGFSGAVPLSLLFRRDPAYRGWLVDFGARGQLSLKNDLATGDAAKLQAAQDDRTIGSLGSFLVNGINPSWLAVHGRVGYRSSDGKSWYVSSDLPVAGNSIPSGILLSLGAVFDLDPQGGEDPTDDSPTKKNRKKSGNRGAPSGFQSYDLEAKVVSSNDQLYLVRIDKGSNDSVEKGQVFDIFHGKETVLRAKVTQVRGEEAVLTVLEYFQDQWIETGWIARRLLK